MGFERAMDGMSAKPVPALTSVEFQGFRRDGQEIRSGTSFPVDSYSETERSLVAHADWQLAIQRAIQDPRQLYDYLELGEPFVTSAQGREFTTLVPWEFVWRMERRNPNDPLLLQVLPTAAEHEAHVGDQVDPVGDRAAFVAGGLIQKYRGRALLVVNAQCAAHCRYCFRRHFPYQETGPTHWPTAMEHLARHADVQELILSGGDPLTLSDRRLSKLVEAVAGIPQIQRLRIHSRLPVLIPQRITPALIEILVSSRLQSWMVVHVNHPQEIDEHVGQAFVRLRQAGIPLLNQAVLLHGINDHVETLAELSCKLINLGTMPYYLHQLDRVAGAAHFEVPIQHGRKLIRELRSRLPGYAVPRYVQDRPGLASKTVLE